MLRQLHVTMPGQFHLSSSVVKGFAPKNHIFFLLSTMTDTDSCNQKYMSPTDFVDIYQNRLFSLSLLSLTLPANIALYELSVWHPLERKTSLYTWFLCVYWPLSLIHAVSGLVAVMLCDHLVRKCCLWCVVAGQITVEKEEEEASRLDVEMLLSMRESTAGCMAHEWI